jgi:hypothetical protein
MRLGTGEPFDLARTFVHLGRGSTATPLPDFEWSTDYVEAYRSRFAGDAMINPANVWHTARVHEPGSALFVTPGEGTGHRPLD